MEGYIIIHKKLLEWQYYKNADMVRLFLHLLLIADNEGNVSVTLKELTEQLDISMQTVRTCIKNLAKEGLINKATNKATNKANTLITVCEYDSYINPKKRTNKATNKATNKHLTNKKADFDARKQAFTDELRPYVATYGRDMVNQFWKYWTESNKSQTKMRWELQATWDTHLRLETWANNELKRNGNNRTTTETKEERAAKYAARINRLLAEDEDKFTDEEEEDE